MSINIILTGATGMVGEGVLLECLDNSAVGSVLVVGRRPCGITHQKLEELVVKDLAALSPAESTMLAGYDACFFCAGVSSVGKKEAEYSKLTYNMTINFAEEYKKVNPDMPQTFCYVSGYGTDSSAAGRSMWARVKGRTENKLLEMFHEGGYMFRPGIMKPVKGQKRVLKFYFGWQITYPIMRFLMPKFACTLQDVARAMINCTIHRPAKHVLEVKDIVETAKSR
ncbi:MAG TPA: NAD-dependent epimerase/dehydratase family protein [Ignavibacteria bacterium]|nr:epimerase [Bacteroidota bacterium]HRE09310.1 NAD-dependent epimerase/dehydratase family protein [Ignavibacteria bacterium]HRF66270.1 NAD-dependent epimerase/dehydratase family protein [Ignavibacteria bacterium]HRJ05071.1 NAD-dependent epimerase/dehydratase family protein [Ignavibacteria bacterium]HRJ85587.1 NAD-dependent epimerase/dehydratase family protein [Ignavibacteria bacterium]